MVISMPRGTQDILPEESIKWQYIEGKLREISKNFAMKKLEHRCLNQQNYSVEVLETLLT